MWSHPHVANYEGNSGQLSCFGQQCCLILPFLYCYIVFLLPYHNCEEVEEANTGRVCLDRSGRASSRGLSSREGSEGSAGALGNQGGVIRIFMKMEIFFKIPGEAGGTTPRGRWKPEANCDSGEASGGGADLSG